MADAIPKPPIEAFRSTLTRLAESAEYVFALHLSPQKRRVELDILRRKIWELRQILPDASAEMKRHFGQIESVRLAEIVTLSEGLTALALQTKLNPDAATEGHGIVDRLKTECRRIQNLNFCTRPEMVRQAPMPENWIHQPGEQPPAGFRSENNGEPFPSVIGTKEELGYTLRSNGSVGVSATQLRNTLEKQARMPLPKIFLRWAEGKQIEAFYKSYKAATEAKAAVAEYRIARSKAIETTSQQKSTQADANQRKRVSTKSKLNRIKRRH